MARKFGSAAAFKTSLEAHLRKRAEERKIPLSTLQLKFVMERLLARLFRNPDPPWLQAVIWKGREGQSWAEKSLKNGRILVEFQKLRKPQHTKGPYFPSNLPCTLPEWGSGGRRFESSRPDVTKACREVTSDTPFFTWGQPFRKLFVSKVGDCYMRLLSCCLIPPTASCTSAFGS